MAKKKTGVIITKELGDVIPESEVKPEPEPEIKSEPKPEPEPEIKSEPKQKNKRKRGSLSKKIIKRSTESLSNVLPSTTPDILPITDTKFKMSKKSILFTLFLVLVIGGIYKRDYIKQKILEIYFTKIKKFDESDE